MDDSDAFPFVIREVISTAHPEDLKEAAANQAVTLSRMADPDGRDDYWCAQLAQPVQRRLQAIDDPARYGTDYVGVDEAGPYVWTHYVALHPHQAGAFGPDARGVVVDFAFVADLSLGADTFFDSSKVDWVATVLVDAGHDAENSAGADSQHVEHEPDWDENWGPGADHGLEFEPEDDAQDGQPQPPASPQASVAVPTPHEQLAQLDTGITPEQFGRALDGALETLASLTGALSGELPRPREMKARKHSRYRGPGPTYSFSGTEVRYNTVDPVEGLVWRTTTNVDEALYWMVDDVARSVAWAWAQRTPASRMMDSSQMQWLLAVPLWLTLVTALDVQWASSTRRRISMLRTHAEESAAQRPQLRP